MENFRKWTKCKKNKAKHLNFKWFEKSLHKNKPSLLFSVMCIDTLIFMT